MFHTQLPTELTIKILKQAISVDFDTLSVDEGPSTPLTTPLLLGAVCSSWPSLVWETPSLWAIIVFKFSYYRCNDQIDILDFWLGKSGLYPLEIWFKSVYMMELFRDPDIGRLPIDDVHKFVDYGPSIAALQKVVDQSTRWKRIHIYVMNNMEFVKVLGHVKGKVPLLEAGNVRVDRGFNDTLDMFEDAPLLRSFSTSDIDNIRILLPWAQLTSFDGSNLYEESCFVVLSHCTSLVECAFFLVAEDDEFLGADIISLPHLYSLSISNSSGKSIKAILDCIHCPSLRQLHLSGQDWNSARGLHCLPIEDFIARSDCVLEVLNLGGLYSCYSVTPVLEQLPSLQSLTMRCGWHHYDSGNDPDMGDSDSFGVFIKLLTKLHLTTATGTTAAFLPNLTELHIKVPPRFLSLSLPHPTSQNLLEVLKKRGRPSSVISRLRKISIPKMLVFDGTTDDEDVTNALNSLAQEGMGISVTFGIADSGNEDVMKSYVVTYPA